MNPAENSYTESSLLQQSNNEDNKRQMRKNLELHHERLNEYRMDLGENLHSITERDYLSEVTSAIRDGSTVR